MTKSNYNSGSQERFGYEWDSYSEIVPEYEGQFLRWVYPLTKEDFQNKKVLDAGCGIGRNSYWPLIYKAAKVVAFDYDKRTVGVAKKNLSKFKNAQVGYNSIYDINYKNEFDVSFSIGVIHHLANPRKAINSLVNATKKNGRVLIWVYGYEGNEWIVQFINPIRRITSRLPPSITHALAYFLSLPLYSYLRLANPSHPYLRQISKFRLWHLHSIVFDQLLPKIANYWKKEEAIALFHNQGLKNVQAYHINDNSWTVIGVKE